MVRCVIAGMLISTFSTSAANADWMIPELHAVAGVTMRWRERTRSAHTEAVFWHFRTAKHFSGHATDGVSQVFERQLRAAGWRQSEADTSNDVFVSAWQRRDAQHRVTAMVFTIHQLSDPQSISPALPSSCHEPRR